MATHSSILAWRILQTKEPGRLQSMESQRVGHAEATEHTQNPIQNKKLKKKKKIRVSLMEEQMEAVLSPLLVLSECSLWECVFIKRLGTYPATVRSEISTSR